MHHQRAVFRVARVVSVTLLALRGLHGQEPVKPDSAKRDTTRRTQSLPTITSVAPRDERVTFEQKPNVGTITITGKELTSAPRFFGEADILRAVRLLPGVAARNDYSVGMNVRGGEADQNLVMLDGYPIYNPFHMGGLFGAFVEPMVDRVDFMTGGFPAQYGGRLSSVLDVKSAVEPRDGVHGRADVSMIATTVALGGGLQQGRGTWTIAARRTYADKAANLIEDGIFPYHFRDFQGHLVTELPRETKLSLTAYDNVDRLENVSSEGVFTLVWGNRVLGATLSRTITGHPEPFSSVIPSASEGPAVRLFGIPLGDSIALEQRVSRSQFDINMNLFDNTLTLQNHVTNDRLAGSVTMYGATHTQKVGYDLGRERFGFGANYPLLLYPSDSLSSDNVTAGAFYDNLWRPNYKWIVQAGARADYVSGLGWPQLQPRLSVKYFINTDLAVTAAIGQFAQSTHSLAREDVPIRALDFWTGSDSVARVSTAQHLILGVERWLAPTRAIRVEGFYKRYPDLIEQNGNSDPNIAGDEFTRLHGYSVGGDLMLRQLDNGRYAGWLAYSFAYSRRTDATGANFFPGQDRRHEVNAVLNRKAGKHVFSMRYNLASGTPYTTVLGMYERRRYDPVSHTYDFSEDLLFLTGPRNDSRLPLSHRLDVSWSRTGRIGNTTFSPFLSIMNVYNARNVFTYLFDYSELPPKRIGIRQFPIFPTLGFSLAW